MQKKRRPRDNAAKTGTAAPLLPGRSALAGFLDGPRAKWAFFAIYLAVTVFLFREFLFSGGTMLFGSDTIPDGVYTRSYYKDFHAQFGGIPRWNPFILGGLPFIDAMHGDTFYPGAWMQFLLPLTRALGHKLIWHVLLAGIGMYAFLRTLRLRRDAAFLGGLMYLLAPSFVSLVFPGHDAKMYVAAWLPVAFALLETGMNAPRVWKFTLLGGVMGLLILTSHVQMAYYADWALGLYFLFRLVSVRKEGVPAIAARAGLFIGACVLAVALGLVQLLPSYTFTTGGQSVRAGAERTSYEYSTSWSMHPEEIMGMIIPAFPGSNTGESTYWGRNPFKLNSEYNGILPVIFAIAALAAWRRSRTWFFLGLGALALLYAVGATTPLYHLFYSLVPGVKNFRAPGMIIFLFAFSITAMSAMFLSALLDRKLGDAAGGRFLLAAGGAILAALVISASGQAFFGLWNALFYHGITPEQTGLMTRNIPAVAADVWRVAILAAAALAGTGLFLSRKLGSPALVALIALVAVIDAAVVDARFIRVIDPSSYPALAPDQSVRDIAEKMDGQPPFRVLDTIVSMSRIHSQNYYAMFGISSADGHHNNQLQSYLLFKGQNGFNFLGGWVDFQTGALNPGGIPGNNFLRVAGVKYILLPTQEGKIELVENTGALERAFIVHGVVTVPSDTAAVERMKDPAFDAAKTAILEGTPAIATAPADSSAPSRVENLIYKPGSTEVTASLGTPGILVLSDNWVPFWSAAIDGNPAPVLRAYGTFMAVAVPSGRHVVTFTFRSKPYETGKTVTLAALGFMVLALASGGGMAFIRRGRRNP